VLRQVVLFAKEHGQTAPGCIGGNPDTIDTAADHGKVIDFSEWSVAGGTSRHGGTESQY
jgi:hypothetical protein